MPTLTSDRRMLELAEILRKPPHNISLSRFAATIGIDKSHFFKIKNPDKYDLSFSAAHINAAIHQFNADPAWIFGVTAEVTSPFLSAHPPAIKTA